jgi:hypothetical protein
MVENGIKWLNENQGVISILLFIVSLMIAWVSGVFNFIRRRPRFIIDILPGPTMISELELEKSAEHVFNKRVAISLYLTIANIGSVSSSISDIEIQYRTNFLKFENFRIWKLISKYENKIEHIKYLYIWFPIIQSCISLENFRYELDDEIIKYYPFLMQNDPLINYSQDTFLEMGKKVNGVVYFESYPYNGGYSPKVIDSCVEIKVLITDAFNKKHTKIIKIPFVSIFEAKKYNNAFGETFKEKVTNN